ncbi:hypothetical protein ACFV23_55440, partial [Streptomyces sp. NPDC059627]
MTRIGQGPLLEGKLVRLEPLEHRHADDLAMAAEEGDRGGATGSPPHGEPGRRGHAESLSSR